MSHPIAWALGGFLLASLLWADFGDEDTSGLATVTEDETQSEIQDESEAEACADESLESAKRSFKPQKRIGEEAKAPMGEEEIELDNDKIINALKDMVEEPTEDFNPADFYLPIDMNGDLPSIETLENLAEFTKALGAEVIRGKVRRNETLFSSLVNHGISRDDANAIIKALDGVLDFRKCRVGTAWDAVYNQGGDFEMFAYHDFNLERYFVRQEEAGLRGYRIVAETKMYVVALAGVIESSLSESLWKQGESDQLTNKIAEIFAWDIDFFSDIRKGDRWKVLIEKHYYNDKFIRYGRPVAAGFHGEKVGDLYAYFFETPDKKRAEYFDDKGRSMQKSFLRAPLNTTRVTSKFGFRMHPTLHKYKKHNGVDYGAPRGTPIWAIAKGTVTSAGWMGACGKGIKIRHSNGYESIYCHLSSIATRRGRYVQQKQMIGRVGSTGRSTGPHLHFGLKRYGKWMNPLKVKYTPGKPVAKKHFDRWKEARALLRDKLDAIEIPTFYGPKAPPVLDAKNVETKEAIHETSEGKKPRKKKPKRYHKRPQGIHPAPG